MPRLNTKTPTLAPLICSSVFAAGFPSHVCRAGRNPLPGNVFYSVDPGTGSDANPGTAKTGAWKTLDRVNAEVFAPGDEILLKAGAVDIGAD